MRWFCFGELPSTNSPVTLDLQPSIVKCELRRPQIRLLPSLLHFDHQCARREAMHGLAIITAHSSANRIIQAFLELELATLHT